MIKAVIFDMDGVLADSQPMHNEADRLALEKLGRKVESGYKMESLAGRSTIERFEFYKNDLGFDADIEEAKDMREAIMLDVIKKEGVMPAKGARDFLIDVKNAGAVTAVASSSPRELIAAVIDALDERKYFDKVVSGADMKRSKPAPDVFLAAAQKLGVEPKHCVVVEDSESGVAAGKAAGMKVLGYFNPTSGNQDLSKADKVIDDFTQMSFAKLKEYFEN